MKKLLTMMACVALFAAFAVVPACKSSSSSTSEGSGGEQSGAYDNYYHGYDGLLSGNKSDIYFINTADNSLLTTFDNAEEVVEFGTHVKLTTPLVIDGEGNILGVKTEVYTKTGVKTECESGGFFALSKAGYTIKFFIQKFTDEAPVVIEKSVKVLGADGVYSDGETTIDFDAAFSVFDVKLIEITENTVNLTSLMSNEAFEACNSAISAGKEVKWKAVSILGDVLELEDEKFSIERYGAGAYAVAAYVDGEDANETIFLDCVDFVDYSKNPEWNDIGDAVDNKFQLSASDNTSAEVVNEILEGDGVKAYKVVSGLKTGISEQYSIKLLPRHSVAYYELFAAEGYSLEFDVYGIGGNGLDKSSYSPIVEEDGTNRKIVMLGRQVYDAKTGKSERGQLAADKTTTFSLPLSEYGKTWDSFITIESVMYTSKEWCYTDYTEVYFSNFRLVKTEIEVERYPLIDIKGKQTIFLSSYIDFDAKTAVNAAENVEYSLTCGDYVLKNTNVKGIINVKDIKTGVYDLSVKADGEIAYETSVDFYDSDKFELYEKVVYKSVESGFITPKLVHSTAYYQKYADYSVAIGVKVTTDADYAEFMVAGENYKDEKYSNAEFNVVINVADVFNRKFFLFAYLGVTYTNGSKNPDDSSKFSAELTIATAKIAVATATSGEVSFDINEGNQKITDLIKSTSAKTQISKNSAFVEYFIATEDGDLIDVIGDTVDPAALGSGKYKFVVKLGGKILYVGDIEVYGELSGGTVEDIEWVKPW